MWRHWRGLPCPPSTVGKFCPFVSPGPQPPPSSPQTPEPAVTAKEGCELRAAHSRHGGHTAAAGMRADGVGSSQHGPALSHHQLTVLLPGGSTPTSVGSRRRSCSCPGASTGASWQDPARAAQVASRCPSGGWVVGPGARGPKRPHRVQTASAGDAAGAQAPQSSQSAGGSLLGSEDPCRAGCGTSEFRVGAGGWHSWPGGLQAGGAA